MEDRMRALVTVVVACGLAVASRAEGEQLILANASRSAYTIEVPAEPSAQEELAAKELQKYFKFMSGVELPIATRAARAKAPRILVAVAREGKGPGGVRFSKEEAEYDAFVVKTAGRDLCLVGSNKRAVLYAVYDFLEQDLGCRWLTFGRWEQGRKNPGKYASDIEEYVPKLARIAVPSLDRREEASLKYRGFICSAWFGNTPAQMIDWMTKNKLNRILIPASQYVAANEWREVVVHRTIIPRGLILAVGHHSFDYFLSRAKYFDKHPEWFPLIDGKRYRGHRTDGQFCLSNPDAVSTYTENVMAFVRSHPEIDVFALYPNDGYGWCECHKCTKDKIPWEERPRWKGRENQAVQDLYLRLINPINERVRKLYPGKRVGIAAYVNYCQPPSVVKPGPGLQVEYAFFTRNWFTTPWGNASGQLVDGPYARELNARFLKKWIELTRHSGGEVMMYEYYAGRSAWRNVSFYLMHLIADELAFFKKIGVAGCSVQAGYGKPAGTWQGKAANLYVFAKTCWDVNVDTDVLLKDYCRHRYGKAAEPMYRYLLEAENQSRHYLKWWVKTDKDKKEQAESLALCQKHLDEAKTFAGAEHVKRLVDEERSLFDALRKFQLSK